jgi:hypothetical protein
MTGHELADLPLAHQFDDAATVKAGIVGVYGEVADVQCS